MVLWLHHNSAGMAQNGKKIKVKKKIMLMVARLQEDGGQLCICIYTNTSVGLASGDELHGCAY